MFWSSDDRARLVLVVLRCFVDLATVSGAPTDTVKVALDELPVPTLVVLITPLLFR